MKEIGLKKRGVDCEAKVFEAIVGALFVCAGRVWAFVRGRSDARPDEERSDAVARRGSGSESGKYVRTGKMKSVARDCASTAAKLES